MAPLPPPLRTLVVVTPSLGRAIRGAPTTVSFDPRLLKFPVEYQAGTAYHPRISEGSSMITRREFVPVSGWEPES